MLFNSLHFLLFLPIVVCLYYLISHRFRWVLLFVSSCYFYMSFVPEYILILFAIIIIDYIIGILIERQEKKGSKLSLLLFSVFSNIGILVFFKYFNFINLNLEAVFGLFGNSYKPISLDVILPIGLSFHTFQSLAYTIEVYRGNQKAERHLGYFANYVLFFPQMVAGPIEKYQNLGVELRKEKNLVYDNISNGLRLILFGFFVKMAVADNLAPIVNQVYAAPNEHHALSVIVAIFFFSFQIYADFYGYSTIAIGAARLLGVNLMDNFKAPYLAVSINDFWKRWHISLTTWFRDYVYIPLGGSKKGNFKWIFNILLVFLISGLWHGASWTFVVWGLLHGTVYLLEKAFSKLLNFKIKECSRFIKVLLCIKTFIIIAFIWIFFRAESFEKAKQIIKAMLLNWDTGGKEIIYGYSFFFVFMLILSDFLFLRSRVDKWMQLHQVYFRWVIYAILLFFVLAMAGMENLPFIYFQF